MLRYTSFKILDQPLFEPSTVVVLPLDHHLCHNLEKKNVRRDKVEFIQSYSYIIMRGERLGYFALTGIIEGQSSRGKQREKIFGWVCSV